jgi:hypothetical protein
MTTKSIIMRRHIKVDNRYYSLFLTNVWFFSMALVVVLLFQWSSILRRTNITNNDEMFFMLRSSKKKTSTNNTNVHFLLARFPSLEVVDVDQVEKYADLIRKSRLMGKETHANHLHVYTTFPKWITSDARWSRHLQFVHNPDHHTSRGAGYQFWKPVLLLYHLQQLREGDFIIYTDPNRVVDILDDIRPLQRFMIQTKSDLALEQHTRILERRRSKPDIYFYYSCLMRSFSDDQDAQDEVLTWQLEAPSDVSMQYNTSFLVIRRNPTTLQFVQDWTNAAQHFELMSDEKSLLTEAPDFQDNQQDQSLLSLLLKCQYKEPAKTMFVLSNNNTSLLEKNDTQTFTFRLDGPAKQAKKLVVKQ